MNNFKNMFSSRLGIVAAGGIIGLLAILLQKFGNPENMGICMACFVRDIAGALGLHRASVVQYLRPEIPAFLLGSTLASFLFKEFRARGGSSPVIRFFLGMSAMIGALVFLGCPWRAILRLAGGDANAIIGFAGLVLGVFVGTLFFRNGYSLGRSQNQVQFSGLVMPMVAVGLIALYFAFPPLVEQDKNEIIFYSLKGPGADHAPIFISLVFGLIVGIIAQRSRFCTMGSLRDIFLFKQFHLASGLLALFVVALIGNLVMGKFSYGFVDQPIAHNDHLWNFIGMVTSGLAFALAGGCPGRQVILSGEGDSDAGTFILGMTAGAAFAHNFALASSPNGVGTHGIVGVLIALGFCLIVGFSHTKKV